VGEVGAFPSTRKSRELLMALGFAVTHVSSADAALGALANARNIDVVVSDVMMPGGVSGLQLAARSISRTRICRSSSPPGTSKRSPT
jgi:CheY-like chemotaxis protein